MNVLVAGGAGYIGNHAVKHLLNSNHSAIIFDTHSEGYQTALMNGAYPQNNLPRFVQGNILDETLLVRTLREHKIDAVMHFAAFIEVGESVENPAKYYENNFVGSLCLLRAMKQARVQKLVFSSTAAVYGNPQTVPIPEHHELKPINPYGKSKLMVEWAIEDFSKTMPLGYTILRYFNVAGASPDALMGESHEPESHLIPRVLQTVQGRSEAINIFGTDYSTFDGTCIRDYIHVEDLVAAHSLALENIKPGKGAVYNLGSEQGFSVRQVIDTCMKVTGKNIPILEMPRRLGDPEVLIASSEKIRNELGWKRQFPDLETIALHAWKWEKEKLKQ